MTTVIAAIIAGAFALASAVGTIWNARAIKQLELDNEQRKVSEQRAREISKYREPLVRAANHLQSRLFNILRKELIPVLYINGNDREKAYVENSTVFLIAQYFCWSELVYREIQYIDLGNNQKTLELLSIQYNIARAWATDLQSRAFRIFAVEQRAIGEALIKPGEKGSECMGYGAFLKAFGPGADPSIDALKADVKALVKQDPYDLGGARERLTNLQHAFIDLLAMLDANHARFPAESRMKA